ncbi:hypothetical protein D3C87_1554830 [compost metagenome]
MAEHREAARLLAADEDRLLAHLLADPLEADRGLADLDAVVGSQAIDQVGGRHGADHHARLLAVLDEVAHQEGDHLVGRVEGALAVHHPEAIRVAVSGEAQVVAALDRLDQLAELAHRGLGHAAAEQRVPVAVQQLHLAAVLLEQGVQVAAAGAVEGVVDDRELGLLHGVRRHQLADPRHVARHGIEGLADLAALGELGA